MPSSPYSTVLHKRNSTPGATPAAVSLSAGELGVNTYDGVLFTKTVEDLIKRFPNDDQIPYKLSLSLSATTPQYGSNIVTQVLSVVLGGYANNITGAASTVANGELNSIAGDFGFIGSGAANTITPTGDFSAILGGHHNLISHANSFTIGSNLTSHAENFTYVNNISATQIVYASEGSSNLWNSTHTTVRSNSAKWETVYTAVNSNSSTYVTLTATQTLTNKTVVDWMTLVRGYNTIPTLLATIAEGEVYSYVYNYSPSNITYYRFISNDGSTDAFYTNFSGTAVSGLVASKSITL